MLFVFRSFRLQTTHSQPFPFSQPHERYHFSILCGKYDFPLETSWQKINGCCCVTAALSPVYWEMVRNAANNIYHPSDILNIYNVIIKSIEKDTRICFEMETKRRKANEKMVRRQKLVLMKWKCGFGVVVRLWIFPNPPPKWLTWWLIKTEMINGFLFAVRLVRWLKWAEQFMGQSARKCAR